MICLRAATKYAALSEIISLGEPRRAMNLRNAVIVSRWIARVAEKVKRQM